MYFVQIFKKYMCIIMLLLQFILPGFSKEERWTAYNLACNISVYKVDKMDNHISYHSGKQT